jgi:hypothetical protein
MTPVQTAALAIRLFAIWLAIYWARWLPYLYTDARDSQGWEATLVLIIVVVLGVAFVLVLWFFPRTVANALLPAEGGAAAATVPPASWFGVGCALLGLWVLASAIPGLVQDAYLLVHAQREKIDLPPNWGGRAVYFVVQLAVGIWLLLGATGVRKLLSWARDARFEESP